MKDLNDPLCIFLSSAFYQLITFKVPSEYESLFGSGFLYSLCFASSDGELIT